MAEPPPPDLKTPDSAPPAGFAEQGLRLARFFTRLPLPVFRFETSPYAAPDLDRAALALPLVGALAGGCAALVGLVAYLVGISTGLAAALSIAAGVIVTGALHEDGFADCCDGFFGGATPERRLEIMRDSRLGTFGTAGLVFSLLIRVLALADLFRLVGPAALLLLVGVAALARPLALAPTLWLVPAAAGGMARVVTPPGARSGGLAMALGLVVGLGCGWPAELSLGMAGAALAGLMAVYATSRLAAARIGGYSGDVIGAAEQVAEMTMLVVLSAAANAHGPV